jgi:hypothetical protein
VVLNLDDPAIRGARIHDRQHHLRGQLDRIAGEYRGDSTHISQLADRLEDEQGGLGGLLLTMPTWAALGVGAAGGSSVAQGVLNTTGLVTVEAVADAVGRLFGRMQQAPAVGRSVLDSALGLAGEAGRWMASTASSIKDRLSAMVADAWNAIWSGLSSKLAAVVEQLSQLRAAAGHPFSMDQVHSVLAGIETPWSLVNLARGPVARYVAMGTRGLLQMNVGRWIGDVQMFRSGRGLYGAANRWIRVKGPSGSLWVLDVIEEYAQGAAIYRRNPNDANWLVNAAKGTGYIAGAGVAAAAGASAALGAAAVGLGLGIGTGINAGSRWSTDRTVSEHLAAGTRSGRSIDDMNAKLARGERLSEAEQARLRELNTTWGAVKGIALFWR